MSASKTKRILLGVFAGLVCNAVLASLIDHIMHSTGVYPPYGEPMLDHGLLLMAFAYRALFMVIGGYLAAAIAKDKGKLTVLILGAVGSLLWLIGAISLWDYAYPWYNIGGVVLGIPITFVGWMLYNRKERHLA